MDTQDELTIYLRQPYTGSQASATRRFSKLGKRPADEERISDKIEIDSDNIETPPATRRLFSPPKEVKPVEKEPCKRERCSSSLQSRDMKTAILKPVNMDLGNGKREERENAREIKKTKYLTFGISPINDNRSHLFQATLTDIRQHDVLVDTKRPRIPRVTRTCRAPSWSATRSRCSDPTPSPWPTRIPARMRTPCCAFGRTS